MPRQLRSQMEFGKEGGLVHFFRCRSAAVENFSMRGSVRWLFLTTRFFISAPPPDGPRRSFDCGSVERWDKRMRAARLRSG